MKIVIVGMGQMGNFYLQKVLEVGVAPQDIFLIDIDPEKISVAKKKFLGVTSLKNICEIVVENDESVVAIVATNTPCHHQVLIDLMERRIRWFLCEKPLGLNTVAVDEICDVMERTNSRVFTAFLMNFSPAILHLIQKMQKEELIMIEGSVVWGKNRYGDMRPTPGDLEDEMIHGAGILHSLCAINQEIQQINVVARLTYPKYANPEAQAKAHDLDPSFPKKVNASTMVVEIIATDRGEVSCNLHSSYIGSRRTRRVTVVLSQANDPGYPVYSVEFDFDVKIDGKTVDRALITTLDGNIVEHLEFRHDKLLAQTQAFITAASEGIIDPRLTNHNEARASVAFSAGVLKSHQTGSQNVLVYTKSDILLVKRGVLGIID